MGSMIKKIIQFIEITRSKKLVPIVQTIPYDKLLDGKTALIIGGTGGIGFAIAKAFTRAGAFVIITGTNIEKLTKYKEILGSKSGCMEFDVLETASMEDKIRYASEMSPHEKIHILVNAAGINLPVSFWDITEKDYDKVMDINVKGIFFASQCFSKYLIKNKIAGHIINISSASALRPAWTPYEMSKWCIEGFTKGLADTLIPYGITVNAIAPGPTATEMLGKKSGDSITSYTSPSGRYETPDEIANLAVFLAGPTGNMIVGDTIYISGGSGVLSMHR